MSIKKDHQLNDAISFVMGTKPEDALTELKQDDGHNKAIKQPENSHDMAINELKPCSKGFKHEKLVNHHIGLYPSDWAALERMATAEGGNVAVLIRRAVREMLSRTPFRE